MAAAVRIVLSLILLAASATALAGCGADDVERTAGVGVAEAAERTAGKGTARTEMTIEFSGGGTPAVELSFSGVGATDRPAGRLTVDLDPVAEIGGLGSSRSGKTEAELLFDGPKLYIRLPDYALFDDFKQGNEWILVDVRSLAEAAELDTGALASLFSIEPSQYLRAIAETPTLRRVGTETIDGEVTDHYTGTDRLSDYARGLDAERRERIRKTLARLEALSPGADEPSRSDIWIDRDGIVRRMVSTAPAEPTKGEIVSKSVMTLSDFGAELDLDKPGGEDVTDLTDLLADLIAEEVG
jgi:hypothetical protein